MPDMDWAMLTAKLEADARADVHEAQVILDRAKRRLQMLTALRHYLATQSTVPHPGTWIDSPERACIEDGCPEPPDATWDRCTRHQDAHEPRTAPES